METKVCNKCKEKKPKTEEFFRLRNWGFESPCRECNREYNRQWKQKNREKVKEQKKKYNKKYPEKLAERAARWKQKNPDKVKEQRKRYHEKYPEKRHENSKQWRFKNPEKLKEQKARGNFTRRARKRNVYYENVDPLMVLDRDKWKCRGCGIKTPQILRGTWEDNAPEVDHIIPLALGGSHVANNLQCLCRKCNQEKGATIEQIS